jgi:hypothetical protein
LHLHTSARDHDRCGLLLGLQVNFERHLQEFNATYTIIVNASNRISCSMHSTYSCTLVDRLWLHVINVVGFKLLLGSGQLPVAMVQGLSSYTVNSQLRFGLCTSVVAGGYPLPSYDGYEVCAVKGIHRNGNQACTYLSYVERESKSLFLRNGSFS